MFFADPLGAFANLRGALRRGGRTVFACWRAAKLNVWQMTPLRAALRCVPRLPEIGPEDPGPFSLADETRVRRVLDGAAHMSLARRRRNLGSSGGPVGSTWSCRGQRIAAAPFR